MIVIIFRHGHKEFSTNENPSLSARGLEQAKNLERLLENHTLPQPTHVWVSEKVRTLQTLQSGLKKSTAFLYEKSDLNYRGAHEDLKNFRNRIQRFLSEINLRRAHHEVHFVCTHYDWIEESLGLIESDRPLDTYELSNWAPGQYVYFEVQDDTYHYVKKGVL